MEEEKDVMKCDQLLNHNSGSAFSPSELSVAHLGVLVKPYC